MALLKMTSHDDQTRLLQLAYPRTRVALRPGTSSRLPEAGNRHALPTFGICDARVCVPGGQKVLQEGRVVDGLGKERHHVVLPHLSGFQALLHAPHFILRSLPAHPSVAPQCCNDQDVIPAMTRVLPPQLLSAILQTTTSGMQNVRRTQ